MELHGEFRLTLSQKRLCPIGGLLSTLLLNAPCRVS